MLHVQLSPAEQELLLQVLTNRLEELRGEIHHAAISTFKEQLKETEVLMKGVLAKVESADSQTESEA
jgi:hypothetical protein